MTAAQTKLTTRQQALLRLFYRFRFGTASLLAAASNTQPRGMNKQLERLLAQQYIGRHFTARDRLQHTPAIYFLCPKGITALRRHLPERSDPQVLRTLYKDRAASTRFISRSLAILAAYGRLKLQYGDDLRFFTKTQLRSYVDLPRPLPDALIRLGNQSFYQEYLLEIAQSDQPFWATRASIKKRLARSEEYTNSQGNVAPLLVVADSAPLHTWLQQQAAHDDEYYDMRAHYLLHSETAHLSLDLSSLV